MYTSMCLAIVCVLLYFQCLRFKWHIFINTLKDALIAAGSGLTLDSQKHTSSSWAQISQMVWKRNYYRILVWVSKDIFAIY